MKEEMVGGGIDWEKVNASLPYQRGEEQQEERRKMWKAIDVSGSGLLSLAKVILISFFSLVKVLIVNLVE